MKERLEFFRKVGWVTHAADNNLLINFQRIFRVKRRIALGVDACVRCEGCERGGGAAGGMSGNERRGKEKRKEKREDV